MNNDSGQCSSILRSIDYFREVSEIMKNEEWIMKNESGHGSSILRSIDYFMEGRKIMNNEKWKMRAGSVAR